MLADLKQNVFKEKEKTILTNQNALYLSILLKSHTEIARESKLFHCKENVLFFNNRLSKQTEIDKRREMEEKKTENICYL